MTGMYTCDACGRVEEVTVSMAHRWIAVAFATLAQVSTPTLRYFCSWSCVHDWTVTAHERERATAEYEASEIVVA
jgi:hypothetical protein